MHLPDGFLDGRTALLSSGLAAAGVGLALRRVRMTLTPRQVPMLGLAAAFVFAAQMLNFPVAGGTSGHLVGGVLAAVLLGPSAAVVVMACVLIVQCLMFADGGLLALGANTFNLAILNICCGYGAFWLTSRLTGTRDLRAMVFASVFAGWVGTVAAAVGCAGVIALSGVAPWNLAFPAMVNIHMLIGLGEGLATGLIVTAVMRARPELVRGQEPAPAAPSAFLGYAAVVSLGLALFVAPFACPWPDGLEHVAEKLGFADKAGEAVFSGPFADYQSPGIGSATLATALAGLIGTIVVFLAACVLTRLLIPGSSPARKNAVGP